MTCWSVRSTRSGRMPGSAAKTGSCSSSSDWFPNTVDPLLAHPPRRPPETETLYESNASLMLGNAVKKRRRRRLASGNRLHEPSNSVKSRVDSQVGKRKVESVDHE